MNRAIKIIMVAFMGLALTKPAVAGLIDGGMIDTKNMSLILLEKVSGDSHVLLGMSNYKISHKNPGRSIVVYPSGLTKELTGSFKDENGARIDAPEGIFDKVIYIGRHGTIIGGTGLSTQDAKALMISQPSTFGQVFGTYLSMVGGLFQRNNFSAIKEAKVAFESGIPESEQVEMFEVTIEMLSGKEFAGMVRTIVRQASGPGHADPATRALNPLKQMARGISTTQDGHVILEGWSMAPDIPLPPRSDLNLGGITMMLSK